MKKLECILLVDDNEDDNFFHQRAIRKAGAADRVVVVQTAKEALESLNDPTHPLRPDLILLDINMPGMNGWEFLDEYEKRVGPGAGKAPHIIVMLTTSENPDDRVRAARSHLVQAFRTKPLTPAMIAELIETFFS